MDGFFFFFLRVGANQWEVIMTIILAAYFKFILEPPVVHALYLSITSLLKGCKHFGEQRTQWNALSEFVFYSIS